MGRSQHNWSIPIVWDPQNFFMCIFTYLENFICLAWVVEILKDPLEEDSAIVAPSHILFTYSDFLFCLYLPILKVSCV